MLYSVDRHLPYKEYPWDEAAVAATIRAILKETCTGVDLVEGLWPIHPKDEYQNAPKFLSEFYFGAAGVLWALNELRDFNTSENNLPVIDEVLAKHMSRPDPNEDSAFCGQLGIRFVKQILNPDGQNSVALKLLMRRAANNPHQEVLYGGPGALAMAHLLWQAGDGTYRELCLEMTSVILAQRELDEASGAKIWTQLFSVKRKFIGAAHGSVGNFGVLIRVFRDLGETEAVRELILDTERFLTKYALEEGDLANWQRGFDADEYSGLKVVHWCHGATGVVTDLAKYISAAESPVLNSLFLKAANLVWKAGPLEKGTSLCHGTAGSGLACLAFFERTGDELWFRRAQGLASYACEQYRTELAAYKRGRHSLWTGDLGLAIFLRDVIRGRGTLPGLA